MTKNELILFDCYRELYANAEPKGDFDELVKNATINERGEKAIPFDDYVIDEKTMKDIIEKHEKRVKPKCKRDSFRFTVYLGCSPKTKRP